MTSNFNAKSTAYQVLSNSNLVGKTIFITGVSLGIGLEMARALISSSIA